MTTTTTTTTTGSAGDGQPANTGWVCPQCRVSHAPWVPSCNCQSAYRWPYVPYVTYVPNVSPTIIWNASCSTSSEGSST